eukprot:6730378-Ditylum_brightwellii.AAC.1
MFKHRKKHYGKSMCSISKLCHGHGPDHEEIKQAPAHPVASEDRFPEMDQNQPDHLPTGLMMFIKALPPSCLGKSYPIL